MTVASVGEKNKGRYIAVSFNHFGKKKGELSLFLPIATN